MRPLPRGLVLVRLAVLVIAGFCLVRAVPQADSAVLGTIGETSSLLLIENVGQFAPQARFLIWNGAATTWLAEDGLWIQQLQLAADPPLAGGTPQIGALRPDPPPVHGVNLRLTFVGADAEAALEPFLRLPVNVSYLVGPPEDWHPAVPIWAGVIVRDLYPGIDLLFDGQGAASGLVPGWRLEVGPGADLSTVRLRIEGADAVAVDEDGLRLTTTIGELTLSRLPVTSEVADVARPVGEAIVSEVTASGIAAFEVPAGVLLTSPAPTVAAPDSTPPPLFYSTFLGGSSWDTASAVTVDATKAAFVAGRTPSSDFPITPGAFDTSSAEIDAFAVKLNAAGTGLEYATFLGGASTDAAYALAVSGGLAYLTGSTLSSDFPTTAGAYDTTCGSDGTCNAGGQGPYTDAFYATLNATGTDLVYATFLGASNDDVGYGISLDGGSAYLTGISYSSDFPASGYDANGDAFVVKMDSAGGLSYGTFLGGGDVEAGFAIAARSGHAYVTGETSSYDFPASGYTAGRETFVSRLDSSGSVVYSKLLAAWGDEMGYAIAVDADQTAYVAGLTTSTDFPVTEGTYGGGSNDAFVARLSSTGATLYAAFLGGNGSDEGRGVAVDAWGGIYVGGRTSSTNFPVTADAVQPSPGGSSDAFVSRYELDSPLPQHITYATYLGGSGYDVAYALTVDSAYAAYLAGQTTSSDFPTSADAFDRSLGGAQDAFVSKLSVGVGPSIAIEKRTNGQDADEMPGPYILVGQPVAWAYVITNNGYMDLHDVTVVDDRGVTVSCPHATLAIDESMTCTASGTAAAGQYSNLGTATGSPPEGEPVSASDPSHYFGVVPGIALEKRTNGQDADTAPGVYVLAGDPVTWAYRVTNTGNVLLEGITVADNQGVTVSCPRTSLAAGESMICTASGTAAVGQYANVGTATGTPPVGPTVTDTDPSHYYGATPAIDLEKHTNGQDGDTVPGAYIPVGADVLWEYIVTNTGNVGLTGVTVTDDLLGAVCTIATLPAGATQTCIKSGTAAEGQYANVGSVTGTPPVGPTVTDSDPSHYFGAATSIDLEKHTNGQDADTAPGPYVLAGDPVAWAYLVTNTGNVTLTDVHVVDNRGVAVTCPKSVLVPGEPMTCTANGTAAAGQYANTGTATGTPPGGLLDVSDADPSHYFGVAPALDLEKSTNGQDADTAPGVYVPVGNPVAWTYHVTNIGNVTLTGVSVVDDQGVTVTCPKTTLTVGEAMTCTAGGTAATGQYANLGTATGTPPIGPNVGDIDPSHYFGATPAIALTKFTNGQDADTTPGPYIPVGDPVLWRYTVTNTGNVQLAGVTVSDDLLGTVCTLATLAPGATRNCAANGTAIAGQYANIGSVVATPPGGLPAVTATDPSHYFGAVPAIDLEKHTVGQDADGTPGPYILVGNPVLWEYLVTNTGNVTLTGVTVVDNQGVTVACPKSTLVAGEAMTCTAGGTAATGQYANLGTASGTPPGGLPDVSDEDPSHYFGATPAIALQKRTNGQDADSAPGPYIPVGDPVSWTYQVTNAGNVTLTGITVVDDRGVTVSCPKSVLAPAESMTCTAAGTASAGQYANTGTATGTPPGGLPDVTGSDPSHYFGAAPAIDVEKHTNGQDADTAPGVYIPVGNPVSWTYHVANTGNVTLAGLTVVDNQGVTVTCPKNTLAPSETTICTASGTAAQGQYANLGTATGTPPGGLPAVSDEDPSHYFGATPSLDLEKSTNGQDADAAPGPYVLVGHPVAWAYRVTNTGNVTLTGVNVVDNRGVVITCPTSVLAPGEATTCTAAGTASAGQYANTGIATGTPPGGLANAADSDPSHYYGTAPSIDLEKHVNGQDADAAPGAYIAVGDTVLWEYHVTNTGNVALVGVTVTDDVLGAVCTIGTLAAGAAETCTLEGTAVAGQHTNLGAVSGTPPVGPNVADSDRSYYFGAIATLDLEKQTEGQDADGAPGVYLPAGDPLLWEYTVTNTGNVALAGVTISDDVEGTVCSLGTLAIGDSRTCTWSGTVAEGQYANLGTASGTPPGGLPVATATDPSHYFGVAASLDLEKHTVGQDADAMPGPYIPVGQAVLWEYHVTNTGNVLLTDVAVADSVLGAICTLPSLDVGQTDTCTRSGTAAVGQYANTGTATGTPPGGLPNVADSDPSHYFGATTGIHLVKLTNGQDANSAPGVYIPVGQAVTWEYRVTNTGNVALTGVAITDDLLGAVCTLSSLAPGASQTCTRSGTAAAGQYANVGTATGTPPGGLPTVSDTDPSHYFGATTGISLAKTTNGQDADSPPGPDVPVGQTVTWQYTVQNTSNVALTNVRVSDDRLGAICTIPSLAAGGSQACSRTGTATIGQYANLGTARGTPPGGLPDVTATDPSHYFGVRITLDLEKHTVGQDADLPPGPYILPGDPVTWSYVVTNTGSVPLNGVTVVDNNGTPGDPGDDYSCPVGRLTPGEVDASCLQNGTAEHGLYSNEATAEGTYSIWTATDSDPSHYLGVVPGLDLEKYTVGQNADTAPGPYLLVGGTVTWNYVVANVGDLEVVDVLVVDDNGTPGNTSDDYECTIASIPIGGADESCIQVGTVQAGQYANLASADGLSGGFAVADLDPSHYFGALPSVDLEKHTVGQDADEGPGPYIPVGDAVLWEYHVTNTGNVALTGVQVADDVLGTVCTLGTLAPGASQTCTAEGTAAAGQYANEGTVTGTPPVGPPVTDSDPSHYFGVSASLQLEKRTNGQDADATPGPYILVGDPLTWQYTVTNTGNVALSDVTLTDDNGTPTDPDDDYVCVIGTLAVGAVDGTTCGQSGAAAAGQYANVASVTGTPPGGLPDVSDDDPSHYYGASPSIALEKHTNGQDADGTPGVYIAVGQAVLWEYLVTNTGNVALADVTVEDDKLGPVCTIASLAAGATQTCTANGSAAAGQYTNQGTATGTSPVGPDVVDSDPSHYFGVAASLNLEKHTNGQDADAAPGVYIPVGDAVLWQYNVTNTGNVALSRVTITDNLLGAVCILSSLAPGATQTCTRSGTATVGQYANVGSASGTPPGSLPAVSDTDPSHYFGTTTGISLVKTTNGQDADSPPGPDVRVGEAVTWEYTVTNEGNVSLTDVTVSDDLVGPICTLPSLAAGISGWCSETGVAAMGQYANEGTVTATPPGGLPDVTASDPSHYFGALVTLDLEKHTNGQDADLAPGPYVLPGDSVVWSYTVTNTGNVALSGVTVVDDNGTPGDPADDYTCPVGTLPAGVVDSSCLQSGTAEQGLYSNEATAEGTYGAWTATDRDPSHYLGVVPGLDLEKYTVGQNADLAPGPYLAVGEPVTWTYVVTNVGDLEVVDILVVDNNGTPADPSDDYTCTVDSIPVGGVDNTSCAQVGAVEAGQYENVASAEGLSGGFGVADLDPSHYYGALPSLDLEKWTNGQDADTAPGPYIPVGAAVEWTYFVTNTGNVALTGLTVTDDLLGTVCTIESLAPGAAETCTADGTATAGQYVNAGAASGTPPGGLPDATGSDPSHYYGSAPSLDLELHTNGQDADAPPGVYIPTGDPVLWEYTVTNTGNVPLVDVSVSDDLLGTLCTLGTLAPGATGTCTAGGTAAEGQFGHVGLASGTPPIGPGVSDTDPSYYFGVSARLDLEKHTVGQDADQVPGVYVPVGEAITWQYTVTNTGNVTLTAVTVTDDVLGPVCTIGSLAPNAAQTCTQSGVALTGQYANEGTASGTPPGGLPDVSDMDLSHYFGATTGISLVKMTNGEDADTLPGPLIDVGQPVTWTYLVTNTGNVTLSQVLVTDDQGLEVTCPGTELAPGVGMACQATGTSTAGQYTNWGTATALPPAGLDAVSADDVSHYYGGRLSIHLEKYTNGVNADLPPGPAILTGEPVQWTYVVENTGTVALSDVSLVDDAGTPGFVGDDYHCHIGTLAPGAMDDTTCLQSGTAEAGPFGNLATVAGFYGELPASDSDPSHYLGASPRITLEKATNGQDADDPPGPSIPAGEPVVWTYLLHNTGNVPLTDILVYDDQGVGVSCPQASLDPGESMVCSGEGLARAGQYRNLGTVHAYWGAVLVADHDYSHYLGLWYRVYVPLLPR